MLKISLKNVASFGEVSATLETDKKNNLVYGLNGTGKTTLSDFLYFIGKDAKFSDCTVDGANGKKILVYNQSFIRDNFYEKEELKGIFTLSKENKKAEEEITRINDKKRQKETERETRQAEKQRYEAQKQEKLNEIKNTIWEIKTTYTGGDRILEFCLSGLRNKKDLLFDYIKKVQKPMTKPSQTIENLKEDAQSIIGENAQRYKELLPANLNIESIEENDIFPEVIVGNEAISVASLIGKLNNSDWVKQGLAYLPDDIENMEKCPFCQQETITKQVALDIKAYFDATYEQKMSEIKRLKREYESGKASLLTIEDYKSHALMQDNKEKFENLYNVIQNSLQNNYSKIEKKLNAPSQELKLENTADKIKAVNNLISEINQAIRVHNERIDNKEQTREEIKDKFWQIMRWEYDKKLHRHHEEDNIINRTIRNVENSLESVNNQIKIYEEEIRNLQQNMVNIEEAIRNINQGLHELGIEGFSIQKYQSNSYSVVREGQQDFQFNTLSEGEKMIISFLYFMELCKGRESEEEVEREKIVVIDDPMSSLSHTYVFNLSQWIKKYFFDGGYSHVFVLTHSLYFFHQLIRHSKNKELFRLTKSSGTGSQIQEMNQSEIRNEYESYWQVIKDHGCNKASGASLANSMRNILEHFFGFISKGELRNTLENLGEGGEFTPFLDYMNRESHSRSSSITDYKEIDSDLFEQAFKKVFVKSGYKKHYDKMMGEGE